MTTIAYKDGVIAYDSRLTRGDTILSDSYNKRVRRDGVDFFVSGDPCDINPFIDAYLNGTDAGTPDCKCFVVDGVEVFEVVIESGKVCKYPVVEHNAIGSGSDHAMTAMDMGATAAEAVKWAAKRDCGTGGRIRTLKINRGGKP